MCSSSPPALDHHRFSSSSHNLCWVVAGVAAIFRSNRRVSSCYWRTFDACASPVFSSCTKSRREMTSTGGILFCRCFVQQRHTYPISWSIELAQVTSTCTYSFGWSFLPAAAIINQLRCLCTCTSQKRDCSRVESSQLWIDIAYMSEKETIYRCTHFSVVWSIPIVHGAYLCGCP